MIVSKACSAWGSKKILAELGKQFALPVRHDHRPQRDKSTWHERTGVKARPPYWCVLLTVGSVPLLPYVLLYSKSLSLRLSFLTAHVSQTISWFVGETTKHSLLLLLCLTKLVGLILLGMHLQAQELNILCFGMCTHICYRPCIKEAALSTSAQLQSPCCVVIVFSHHSVLVNWTMSHFIPQSSCTFAGTSHS